MFSPAANALDLISRLTLGQLVRSPMQLGTWAVLAPAGLQNHAPQLCWLSQNQLGCVWMAGGQEGTAGMRIVLSTLRRGAAAGAAPINFSGW